MLEQALFEENKRDLLLQHIYYKDFMEYYPKSNMFKPSVLAKLANPNHDRAHRKRLSWSRCYKQLEYATLIYSAGHPMNEVLPLFSTMFTEFTRHKNEFPEYALKLWEPDAYQYALWLLGLVVLCGRPEDVPMLASIISRDEEDGHDPLIATLLAGLGVNDFPTTDKLIFEQPFSHLQQAAIPASQAEAGQREAAMVVYLNNWYQGTKNCYWHGYHERILNAYFGYWAFEAGMVTLIYGLDDSSYRDMTFYPKDFVDYAREQGFDKKFQHV